MTRSKTMACAWEQTGTNPPSTTDSSIVPRRPILRSGLARVDTEKSGGKMSGDIARGGGILFVCTGNVCRSPYAERRLRQLLPHAGASIASAGTAAVVGADLESATKDRLRRVGADVTGFAAQALTTQ